MWPQRARGAPGGDISGGEWTSVKPRDRGAHGGVPVLAGRFWGERVRVSGSPGSPKEVALFPRGVLASIGESRCPLGCIWSPKGAFPCGSRYLWGLPVPSRGSEGGLGDSVVPETLSVRVTEVPVSLGQNYGEVMVFLGRPGVSGGALGGVSGFPRLWGVPFPVPWGCFRGCQWIPGAVRGSRPFPVSRRRYNFMNGSLAPASVP